MQLIEELRQNTKIASRTKRGREKSQEAQRDEQRIQRDKENAQKLIRDLPPLLRNAAKGGAHSFVVMGLEKGFHCDWDVQTVIKEVGLHGATSAVIRHGAWTVMNWLTEEGFKITLRAEDQNDEGQGRSWTTLHIVASW